MLLVSSRADFWSSTNFSDEDAIGDVVLERPSASRDRDMPRAEYLKALAGRKVLLLVHGYNNTEDAVALAYARIERAVNKAFGRHYDVITGYTWPGGAIGLSYPSRGRGPTQPGRVSPAGSARSPARPPASTSCRTASARAWC